MKRRYAGFGSTRITTGTDVFCRWWRTPATSLSDMKNVGPKLAAVGGIALFALASAAPALADLQRHHSRHQWHDHKPHQWQDRWRHRNRPRIGSDRRRYRYFGAEPDRYFGVGPGSYECYGFDCNW